MKASDHLWRLVHFLDKAESRFFRLFAQLQKGRKQYEHLYEAVSKVKNLDKYDESLIREQLDREGKLPARSFAVTKMYLFDNILKALRLLEEDKTVENRVRKLYHEASVLLSRGLINKSFSCVREAKQLAEKYECFSVLADLLSLEIYHNFVYLKPSGDPLAELEALYREKQTVLEKMALDAEANWLRDQAYILYRTWNTQPGESREARIRELRNHPFLKEPGKPRTFRSELFFHHAWALIYYIENKNKRLALYHSDRTLEIWDKYPAFKKEYPRLYKVNLFANLGTRHSFNNYLGFEDTLNEARKLESRTISEKTSDFQDTAHYHLLFLINACRFEEARQLVAELEEKIKGYSRRKYPLRKDKMITLYHNTAVLFFLAEEYDETLRWAQKLRKISGKKSMARLDIQYFAYILKLLVHFEKGEADKLDHIEPYVKKKLKTNDMLSGFDASVLSHIRKLNKSYIAEEDRKIYEGLLAEIKSSEQKHTKIRGRAEIKLWVESKLQRKKIADLLREQFEAAMAEARALSHSNDKAPSA